MESEDGFIAKMAWRIAIVAVVSAVAAGAGCPPYWRYQARMEAANQITLNNLKIQQTQQLVDVEKQRAQIREQEANGIAKAQQIINATLTDRYLQHEAIEAQLKMAGSPNHTQIYVPVGTNGIPLVKTIGPEK